MNRFSQILSLLEDRINMFYILTFAPILIILYRNPLGAMIPIYGFILILLKSQKLRSFKNANVVQRILGLIFVGGSFFIYYALVLIFTRVDFYGAVNYFVYLFGLFMVFFDLKALREAFTPLFLIAAATSSTFVEAWLKPLFSPYVDDFAYLIARVLEILGLNVSVFFSGSVPILRLHSLAENVIDAAFVYECIGVYSALVFSIILVIILFEDPAHWKVKLLFSVVGIVVTFALNIVRVSIILLTDYFYGAEVGGNVHIVIGYILFTVWIALFLYAYSKRKTVMLKIQSFWRRLNQSKMQINIARMDLLRFFGKFRIFCIEFGYIRSRSNL